jgi:hypothetical protein
VIADAEADVGVSRMPQPDGDRPFSDRGQLRPGGNRGTPVTLQRETRSSTFANGLGPIPGLKPTIALSPGVDEPEM